MSFELLDQVRELLGDKFIDTPPNSETQQYGAIRGLVSSYKDPFTVFVEPAPRHIERDEIRGHFGGIGAQMSRNQAGDVVLTVMRDRPAARAGVQDGDVLIAVDGKPITPGMTIQDVVSMVRGDEGTKVLLALRRAGRDGAFDIPVVRARIDTPSVEWRVLNDIDHTGYVKVGLFGEQTNRELQTGLAELASQGVNKLVLDLGETAADWWIRRSILPVSFSLTVSSCVRPSVEA